MRTRIFIFTVIATLAAVALATGFILVWRLLFISILLCLISYLWTVFGIRGLSCQVKQLPKRYQVGDYFEEEFILSNNSKMPKFIIKVQENTNLPGHQNTLTLNLPAKQCQYLRTRVICQQRGQYHLGSFTLTATDPFGLFSRQRHCGEPQSLLVCPATVELPFFWLSPRHVSRSVDSSWLQNQTNPVVVSVRKYVPGDSLKYVHWPRTAHAGEFLVKTFDNDRSHYGIKSLWIVVDMCRASYLGDRDSSLEEYCVTIAASLAKKCIYAGMAVGLIALGEKPYNFPPDSGEQHLWNMLETMALMKATGDVPVEQLIINESPHFRSESALIVITRSNSEKLVKSFHHVKTPRELTTIILLDGNPAENVRAIDVSRALRLSGMQVYQVVPGEKLASALDSRKL